MLPGSYAASVVAFEMLAQMAGGTNVGGDPSSWLLPLLTQSPIVGILAWMLYTQQQDRAAHLEIMRNQGVKLDRLARSILVLSLHLGSSGPPNPNATKEAKEILRELGERTTE